MKREYYIVSAGDASRLEQRVNEKLDKGWNLVGGLVVRGYDFFQAVERLVKEEPIDYDPNRR